MTKYFSKKNKGFTLIETMVAITILMISIAGPLVLVGNGIRFSTFARDQITAFYLAQDAIEAMRYIRDGNRIAKVTDANPEQVEWDHITQYSCTEANPCGIDTLKIYGGSAQTPITTATANDYLHIDSQGRYSYDSGGTQTHFKRYITIEEIAENKEVQIIVRVDWSAGIVTRTFSIRENLFYWY
jgi:prepilin-type N-terminal cleavage/methylation domain-containing protein